MINKVLGLGLSRTGTMSLTSALCMLGFKAIHYPEDPQTYRDIVEANYRLSVFDTYQAVTDTPVVCFYPQFDQLYPGSKFILTIRDKESWLDSVELHWKRGDHVVGSPAIYKPTFDMFISALVYGSHVFHKDRFSYVYDLHAKNVREYFAGRPNDLLVLNICGGDGWDPLCRFLGKPIPEAAFPHENRRFHEPRWTRG
jgi:hypothetical protein